MYLHILPLKEKDFYVRHNKFLIGIKMFRLEKDGLYNMFNDRKYRFKIQNKFNELVSNDEFVISYRKEIISKVYMEIPYYWDAINFKYDSETRIIKIPIGYTISPFQNEIMRIHDEELKYSHSIFIPVMFSINDIVFYDGRDVSTTMFTLIPPDTFKVIKFPKEVNNLDGYDKHYNELKNIIKQGNEDERN